jgi:uncharacterized protein
MTSIVKMLTKKQAVRPPSYVSDSLQYETIMGSNAYAVSNDMSDVDVYGFCIPHKDIIFPHLRGEIHDFGEPGERFQQWAEHHIKDPTGKEREYDCQVYSMPRYFHLCMKCNPNMIDSLFTPPRCVTFATPIGQMVKEKRHIFLHKGVWKTFRGFAGGELRRLKGENSGKKAEGKRKATIEKFGWDVKSGYNIVRCLLEARQVLEEGDLDLELNREVLKAIRAGSMSLEELDKYYHSMERELESVYNRSTLRAKENHDAVKQLLIDCLEQHFGSLQGALHTVDPATATLREIEAALAKYRQRTEDSK